MANINQIQCADTLKNTGICDCYFDPKNIVGKIIVPRSKVFTQAELDDIQDTLETLRLASRATRIFPVQGFVAITDNSEDPTFQQFGYGGSAPVREGNYNWIFQFTEGGVQLSNSLRSFNGKSSKYAELYILRDTGKHILLGTSRKDANGDNGLAGVPQEGGYPYTYPWKANDGTNVAMYRTQSMFKPEYINDNIAFVEIPNTTYMLTDLTGLEDVTIEQVEVEDDTVTVKLKSACGSDLYADEGFDAELAQAVAWELRDADGDIVTITDVNANAALEAWEIVANTPILNDFTLKLVAPATLAAAPINVNGYESGTLEIDFGS